MFPPETDNLASTTKQYLAQADLGQSSTVQQDQARSLSLEPTQDASELLVTMGS